MRTSSTARRKYEERIDVAVARVRAWIVPTRTIGAGTRPNTLVPARTTSVQMGTSNSQLIQTVLPILECERSAHVASRAKPRGCLVREDGQRTPPSRLGRYTLPEQLIAALLNGSSKSALKRAEQAGQKNGYDRTDARKRGGAANRRKVLQKEGTEHHHQEEKKKKKEQKHARQSAPAVPRSTAENTS